MLPKITQKRNKLYVFTGNISKTPFSILIASHREMHEQKMVNVKTLPRTYAFRTHQRVHSKMWHLGMLTLQPHSAKLTI